MKRLILLIIGVLLLLPAAIGVMQDAPPLRVEITGVNPTDLPTVVVTTSVFDRLGQPIFGLTSENFAITGELAERARIVSVENISDDDLAFSVVLAIDTSSSMADEPLARAKEAAITFINSIGPNDPVAIVTFDTREQLIQDYTTDKNTLINAINNLGFGGKTALFDGGLLSVETAANSPTSRRAVILLSDGAEFGGVSASARDAALSEALVRGVPVYTIGLGYGIDRSYLEDLSGNTNAKFYESPTPQQLLEIYTGLAATLRSQYVITIEADLPADGTSYDLEIQTTDTAGNSATARTALRAPIPVPIVTFDGLPAEPLTEATTVTAAVVADDGITSGEFVLDGASVLTGTEAPFSLTVDPVALTPGDHTLTFNATDANGDVGSVTQTFGVAALPPVVTLLGLPDGAISEQTTVLADVTGQTPAASVSYSVDGGEATVTEAPFAFTLDPYAFTPGDHVLSVAATNQGGLTTTVETPFSVAAVPPAVTVNGLAADQTVDASTSVEALVTQSQSPIQTISLSLNGEALGSTSGQISASALIDPVTLPPGPATLEVTATDTNGQSATTSIPFTVAAVPPAVTVNGLSADQTLDASTSVEAVVTQSQSPVQTISLSLNGEALASTSGQSSASALIDPAALQPGPATLEVTATDTNGQSTTTSIPFTVAAVPPQVTLSGIEAGETIEENRTVTLDVVSQTAVSGVRYLLDGVEIGSQTEAPFSFEIDVLAAEPGAHIFSAVVTNEGGDAQTDVAFIVAEGPSLTATALVPTNTPTLIPTATVNATGTAFAVAQATNAAATSTAEVQVQAAMTAQAESQANARATQDAQAAAATSTVAAQNALGAEAMTQTAVAQAEQDAQAAATQTAVAQAEQDALAGTQTADAQAALGAQSATQTADAQAAINAQSTQNAQATLEAQSTVDGMTTANAQAAIDAQATRDARQTATAESQAAQATEEATAAEPTSAGPDATVEPTEEVNIPATPTGDSATSSTPAPTLTPVEMITETQGAASGADNIIPIAVCIAGVLLLLVILFFVITGRRRQQQR
ncbi:MAG: VWA domain-containing protein [Anaerolineae bacterium]|nr:VWA domain-containing protein [Anaerolineae bacterium]